VPHALRDSAGVMPEKRFLGVVRTLLGGYREVGAPGYAEAWSRLLRDADPMIVAGALERLDAEADVNPNPASAFAADLEACVAHRDRGLRLHAASRIGRWLGRTEREGAGKRLAAASQSTRPFLRPAAALACMELEPHDPRRHAALLRVLADEAVPVTEAAAVAAELISIDTTIPKDVPLAFVDGAARDAVASIRDPSLLAQVCAYLARLRGRYERPESADAERERANWLAILDASPRDDAPRDAPAAQPDPDSYLTPVERAVLVPHDAKDRPLLARLVRASRRAKNARRAGDSAAALDSYRDIFSAAMVLDDAQRKVLLQFGLDLEAASREARALDDAK
jgi:hypothetical protein